jgi:hypothetical protein
LVALEREERKRVLAQRDLGDATGIHDLVQLRELIVAGVTPRTVAALGIVPLVCVAWASGYVHPNERAVALAAAVAAGVSAESDAFSMFSSWLDEQPDLLLLDIWGSYLRALRRRVPAATYDELRNHLLVRSRKIAEAAGGPGDRGEVSSAEAEVLARIKELLD